MKKNAQEINTDPISGTKKKYCSKCEALKPLFSFTKSQNDRSGYHSMCNNCRTTRGGKYRGARVDIKPEFSRLKGLPTAKTKRPKHDQPVFAPDTRRHQKQQTGQYYREIGAIMDEFGVDLETAHEIREASKRDKRKHGGTE